MANTVAGTDIETTYFGFHLMLDLYSCDLESLRDEKLCMTALEELPGILGMTIFQPPQLARLEESEDLEDQKDPGGLSGFVMIKESHISLHTFPKRGFVSIDVYSCEPFSKDKAVRYFEELFKSKDSEINFVKRGSRYPKENIY